MITYDFDKKRVKQVLGTAISSFYDLEGSFADAIKHLKELEADCKRDYVDKAQIVHETKWNGEGMYADGDKKKAVQFDKLILDCRPKDHEEGDNLVLIGERDMLPEEIEAAKKQQEEEEAKIKKRELQERDRLNKKYKD